MNTFDWKNATPEQLNFWNLCNIKIAWNTITPLFYSGVIAASEFTVYNAAKIYLALEIVPFGGSAANIPNLLTYDEANAAATYFGVCSAYWDVTAEAPKYMGLSVMLYNVFFSRVVASGYTHIKFNGYKLTIV